MYTAEEILAELNKLNWNTPERFRNNQKDSSGNYFLFRGHGTLEDDNFATPGLVHLTPFFDVASSLMRFKLSASYLNFPVNYCLVSVYTGGKENKFYPDETIEYVLKGKQADNGNHIDNITIFDKDKHFETKKNPDNQKIATYIVKFESFFDKDKCKIAEISNSLKEILQTNKKTNQITISNQRDI